MREITCRCSIFPEDEITFEIEDDGRLSIEESHGIMVLSKADTQALKEFLS